VLSTISIPFLFQEWTEDLINVLTLQIFSRIAPIPLHSLYLSLSLSLSVIFPSIYHLFNFRILIPTLSRAERCLAWDRTTQKLTFHPYATDNCWQCEKHSKKEEALEKLRGGAKFDDVAREFSEDKARQGGSLGWKTRGSLDPAFEKVAYDLEPSTTGSPKYVEVKTGFGYHIIMVEGRK